MEFNNCKKAESPVVDEFIGSFQEPDIDIKMETPYFEVYDRCFRDENVNETVRLSEAEDFEGIKQENYMECNDEIPNVEECGVSTQGKHNVSKKNSETEELPGNIEEEYMDFENNRSDDVKMARHECCNGGLLVLVPLPNICHKMMTSHECSNVGLLV